MKRKDNFRKFYFQVHVLFDDLHHKVLFFPAHLPEDYNQDDVVGFAEDSGLIKSEEVLYVSKVNQLTHSEFVDLITARLEA